MAPRLWNAVIITIRIIASVKDQHVHHKKRELCKINQNHRQMISAQTSFATYCASSPYYLEVVTPFPPGPNTWSSRKRSLLDLKMSVIRCLRCKGYKLQLWSDWTTGCYICNLLRCTVYCHVQNSILATLDLEILLRWLRNLKNITLQHVFPSLLFSEGAFLLQLFPEYKLIIHPTQKNIQQLSICINCINCNNSSNSPRSSGHLGDPLAIKRCLFAGSNMSIIFNDVSQILWASRTSL